jgi:hypothetical protein
LKIEACRHAPRRPTSVGLDRALKLNDAFISTHPHDYFDLNGFLRQIRRRGPHHLLSQPTVYFFLEKDILSMPLDTYQATLKLFERGLPIQQYLDVMQKRDLSAIDDHQTLVERLVESAVLR